MNGSGTSKGANFFLKTILLMQLSLFGCNSPKEVDPSGEDQFNPKSIMWVGAHPDDEFYVGAYLAKHCGDRKIPCQLVVLTHGESGSCNKSTGCLPDLGTVRHYEMKEAALQINANLIHENWGDGTQGINGDPKIVLNNWALHNHGSSQVMLQWMRDRILDFNPDVLITFDPRNGIYCHPDHQAAGELAVLGAVEAGMDKSKIFMVEELYKIHYINGNYQRGAYFDHAQDQLIFNFNSSGFLPTFGMSAYNVSVNNLLIHESQFNSKQGAILHGLPIDFQKIHFLKLSDAKEKDERYLSFCK